MIGQKPRGGSSSACLRRWLWDVARRRAYRAAASSAGEAPLSALSIAAPALFGARALDLTLLPPDGEALVMAPERERMAGFPDQPERFVGRVAVMTRATAVLAPGSGRPGVVFHGMAGAG